MNSSQKGIQFEQWITNLYDELGKLRVEHNIIKKKKTKNGVIRSQFDVTYGLLKKTYVECKYHENNNKVTFNEISTFRAKLALHNIHQSKGVLVTNANVETRARAYAHKEGVEIIDREKLVSLDWKRSYQYSALFKGAPKTFAQDLEKRILSYRA